MQTTTKKQGIITLFEQEDHILSMIESFLVDRKPDISCDYIFQEVEPRATSTSKGKMSNIIITTIFFDGVVSNNEPDEYVEIKNSGSEAIPLQKWMLVDEARHQYLFTEFNIVPEQICRIYTNEYHPEWCNINYLETNSAIWNNDGDCANLYDESGNLVQIYCY